MSNFITKFNDGQQDLTRGIPFGRGLEQISLIMNGIQDHKIYGVAGPQKSGKSTLTDYAFVLEPYLYSLDTGVKIQWVYYSFEIDRVSKEFDFATFFLHNDFGIEMIKLPPGVLRDGKDTIELSPQYLRGILMDDNFQPIKIDTYVYECLKQVYDNRIIPLFGEYSEEGIKISDGLIDFREGRENPTGVYKDMLKKAESEGTFIKDNNEKYISYTPGESITTIVVVDHIRKLKLERNFQIKQTIDKMSEYMVILRNLLGYVFVPILHTNRNLTSGEKIKFAGQDLYPTADDLKDSGNLGEDCDYLLTIFNPNDDKYNLKEHFGFKIKDSHNNRLYPNLRTIHLVESRHCEFPRHFKVNMKGNFKKFEKLIIEI